jgi:DNA-directed RNA polymerase specialized sigma24 family protein
MRVAQSCASKQIHDAQLARDVALGVIVDYWRTLGTPAGYDATRPLRPWVAQCVRLRYRFERRSAARRHESAWLDDPLLDGPTGTATDAHSDVEWRAQAADMERIYRKVLRELTPDRRAVWLLKRRDRRSDEAIARERGIAVPTVRAHYLNAARQFRAAADLYRRGEL